MSKEQKIPFVLVFRTFICLTVHFIYGPIRFLSQRKIKMRAMQNAMSICFLAFSMVSLLLSLPTLISGSIGSPCDRTGNIFK